MNNLNIHIKTIHENKKRPKMKKEQDGFEEIEILKEPIPKQSMKYQTQSYFCKICNNFSCYQIIDLRNHFIKTHNLPRKIIHDTLKQQHNVSEELSELIESSDEEELKILDEHIPQHRKKFHCTMCNFSCYQSIELMNHKKIHKSTIQTKLKNYLKHDVSKEKDTKVIDVEQQINPELDNDKENDIAKGTHKEFNTKIDKNEDISDHKLEKANCDSIKCDFDLKDRSLFGVVKVYIALLSFKAIYVSVR